jgi:hypothetical protein
VGPRGCRVRKARTRHSHRLVKPAREPRQAGVGDLAEREARRRERARALTERMRRAKPQAAE